MLIIIDTQFLNVRNILKIPHCVSFTKVLMTFITETTCIPKTLYEKLMKAFRPKKEEISQRDHLLDYTLDDNLDYTLAEDEMAEPEQYKYVMKTL